MRTWYRSCAIPMLAFDTIVGHKAGIIASMLTQSYAELLSSGQEF